VAESVPNFAYPGVYVRCSAEQNSRVEHTWKLRDVGEIGVNRGTSISTASRMVSVLVVLDRLGVNSEALL
jgi:hypothetical protein